VNGCATRPKEKPIHERGWVGGEYKPVATPRTPPSAKATLQTKALLVTALSSNTPARRAGVLEGDVILELNHEPTARLEDFRAAIDRAVPGTSLPVKVYRNGELIDYHLVVGRETFRRWGTFTIGLWPMLRQPDLWPDPDFSLVVLGYETQHGRAELNSAENAYRRSYDPDYHPWDGEWSVWLAIFRSAKSKEIISQEIVESRPL
jgi:serine protease Do